MIVGIVLISAWFAAVCFTGHLINRMMDQDQVPDFSEVEAGSLEDALFGDECEHPPRYVRKELLVPDWREAQRSHEVYDDIP